MLPLPSVPSDGSGGGGWVGVGEGHIAQRERPLVQLLLVCPQRQDASSLGSQPGPKGCERGAKDAFHQYVTDLLKTAVQLTHHSFQLSLPHVSKSGLKSASTVLSAGGKSLFLIFVAFGFCEPVLLDAFSFVVFTHTVRANNVNRM